jgi:hypothetical protein
VRHLHEKVSKIDERTAPKKEEDSEEAHAAAAQAAMGGGMMGFGETLMLTGGGPGYDQVCLHPMLILYKLYSICTSQIHPILSYIVLCCQYIIKVA